MRTGVDISKWQGNVDFARVSKNVDFVILREGYRKAIDPMFLSYTEGCRKNGIPIDGVYHFCYSLNDADTLAEAEACVEHVESAGLGKDTVIFFDFEYDTVSDAQKRGVWLGKQECIRFTRIFCDYIQSHGYRAGVYTNMDYYRRMYTPDSISQYVLWLADYSGAPDIPCAYHQYTDKGHVDGIAGNVDMDYCYVDKEEQKMGVLIGSARSNENGGINGGKPGDQTGGEVSTQAWYLHSKGWKVLRPMDKAVAEKIARNMEAACANPNIGYCQDHRDSLILAAKPYGYDAAKVDKPVEADCGGLVRLCCLYAGISVGDFYTGNEAEVLIKTGEFAMFESDKFCKSADYLERGDILVTRSKGHTVVALSDGDKVEKQVTEGWKQAGDGRWWYQNADGTYPRGGWAYLNEATGGTSGWYLFDADGYMLTGAQVAPDGKMYYLCDAPGIHEGQCMVTDEKGALMVAEWDAGAGRYKVG